MSGNVILKGKVKPAMVRFGFLGEDNMYWNSEKTLLNIQGTFELSSKNRFANGVIIRVDKNAKLSLEKNVSIGNKSKIICSELITIGEDTSITWECQIIDTNFHYIVDLNDKSVTKLTQPIVIGKNVFIGYRSTISKGVILEDFAIVCSYSLVNKNMELDKYSMYAGIPAKIIKKGYYRAMYNEEREIKQKIANKL
ncbi:acyltransferase [Empedobacter stercoris]|uniref:Acyltransferase n=1 Tax=Empedobacter falsenii TaxID=343874 RepID=A0ABY8V530_9FLAO|nr:MULTISPECIES: acyltransferase [Empedobacter]UWX66027.1 acyltransferase [Empedobacter stercoris]WIH96252.1 acyltransferase [Empedobacter falsenii]